MSFAIYEAKKENKVYEDLKRGRAKALTLNEERDIELLSILEKLGYPMDHFGTYLYKDLIASICDEIEHMSIGELQQKDQSMTVALNDGYSSFYRWLASDDKELGCKTFHSYIQGAIDSINKAKVDTTLASKIYGNTKDITYGTSAMHIAQYYLNSHTYSKGSSYKAPRVKKLANVHVENRNEYFKTK